MDADETVPQNPAGEALYTCFRCGSLMEEHHCKVLCKNCGYFMDCSDLF